MKKLIGFFIDIIEIKKIINIFKIILIVIKNFLKNKK